MLSDEEKRLTGGAVFSLESRQCLQCWLDEDSEDSQK